MDKIFLLSISLYTNKTEEMKKKYYDSAMKINVQKKQYKC